jgi:hypothetical protein
MKYLRTTVKKAYQLRPGGSASCVSFRNTTKHPKRTGKETRNTVRVSTHAHAYTRTHTQKYKDITKHLSFRNCRRPRTPGVFGISQTVSYVLAMILMRKFIYFSKNSAFCDREYFCFPPASIFLLKNLLQTGDAS